jgi:hypothetical protein
MEVPMPRTLPTLITLYLSIQTYILGEISRFQFWVFFHQLLTLRVNLFMPY